MWTQFSSGCLLSIHQALRSTLVLMRKCLCSASSPASHLPATLSLFTFLQASIATSLVCAFPRYMVKETPREQLTRYILELPVRIILKTWAQVTIKQTEKLLPARILIMESLLMCVCTNVCVKGWGWDSMACVVKARRQFSGSVLSLWVLVIKLRPPGLFSKLFYT